MFITKCGYCKNTKSKQTKNGNIQISWHSSDTCHCMRGNPSIQYIWVWLNAENAEWENITMKIKAVPLVKSSCSHEAQGGNERNSPSTPFFRASHLSTGHVLCQDKFQVVSTPALIVTNQAFLDRLFNVITCVSKCWGETVVLHFPFMAWPQ